MSSCGLSTAQGRTPSRFLSSYFTTQCNIYGGEGGLSQNDGSQEGMPSQPASQEGVFGTLDFITPQEHQFTVGHNDADPNKENKPMRSPCQLSPGARKKPKTYVYNSDSDMECSQEQRGGGTPCTSSQPDHGQHPQHPGMSRSSILHYVTGSVPSGSFSKPPVGSARKRGIMAPPPVRSPPTVPNPFLNGDTAASTDSKRSCLGQPPASRYRADFKELAVLGTGSFSKVYKAKHRIDGAEYAIKRSAKELYTPRDKADALQEVQALAAAGAHPNLVRYFTAWMEKAGDGEHLYIQMELCGTSLAKMVEQGHQFTETELMDIMKQVAAGLKHLHELGMVHLDVKPDNIYVSNDHKRFVLGDFGLVTRTDGSLKINEGDGRYLPLEMMNDNHSHLDKVDMFSLGAALYELAMGQPLPTEGPAYQALRRGKAPMPPRFAAVCPLVRTIKALLSEAPQERPSADSICRGAIGRTGLGLLLQPSSLGRPKN